MKSIKNNSISRTGIMVIFLILAVSALAVAKPMYDPGPKPTPVDDANCTISVNGGGWILSVVNATTGETAKSNFQLNVQSKNDVYSGIVKYHDGLLNLDVRSLDISKVLVYNTTYNVVLITGNASFNGSGSYPFYITVSDAGEQGKNDYFVITLPSIRFAPGEIGEQSLPTVPPWVIIPIPYEPPYDILPIYSNFGYLRGGNIQVKIINCPIPTPSPTDTPKPTDTVAITPLPVDTIIIPTIVPTDIEPVRPINLNSHTGNIDGGKGGIGGDVKI